MIKASADNPPMTPPTIMPPAGREALDFDELLVFVDMFVADPAGASPSSDGVLPIAGTRK